MYAYPWTIFSFRDFIGNCPSYLFFGYGRTYFKLETTYSCTNRKRVRKGDDKYKD